MKTRVRVSGAGVAVGRDDGRVRRASGGSRDVRRSVERARSGSVDARLVRARVRLEPDGQYAAGDADGGRSRCGAHGRRRAGRCPASSPGTVSANTRRSSRRAHSLLRDALPLVRFRAQAMQEAVPAGVGAMAAILGLDAAAVAAVCREAAQCVADRRVRQFQRPEQIVDRRPQGSRRARDRARDRTRGEARRPAAGVRAVSQFAPRGRRRNGWRRGSRTSRSTPPSIPVLHNVDVAEKRDAATRSGRHSRSRRRAPCAGSRSSRRSPPAASRTWSNADRGGCWPASTSGSSASSSRWRSTDGADMAAAKAALAS